MRAFARVAVTSLFLGTSALAQSVTPRLTAKIDSSLRTELPGSKSPRANSANDKGSLSSTATLEGIGIVFNRSAEQESALQALLAAQQNPSSPQYHAWLTPEQFAAQFGMSGADLVKIQAWLQQQGFVVTGISRSRNRITFSGTPAQAETAFSTELHSYQSAEKTYYAPSTNLSLPAAVSPVVLAVTNLSNLRPAPHFRPKQPGANSGALFTSSQSGSHYLTPSDVTTIYDVKPAYNAGYTGSGQTIAIVGQSSVLLADIEKFQTAAGLAVKDPTLTLVPNSGTATIYSGDEAESDLDLEYSGAIAKGATIEFVYVGNSQNYSVWDSIEYAVDNKLAAIISTSYGACETAYSATEYAAANAILEQAAAQGQTVLAASGDDGSTDCYQDTSLTLAQRTGLAVDFPASSQYVTAMGGTEFPSADVAASNTTYWGSASGSDLISSALSYIPEQAWNDDSASSGLSSGGGGTSVLTARPSWQAGVTGIASGSYRLVPDISLDSSADNAGYLYCSSDSASTGITGSCTNGFRDTNDTYLTVAGGTSFAAPIFAGMLAIINQSQSSSGQGVINPSLYSLAANSTAYASAFHDVSTGGNTCSAGSTYCIAAGESAYSATTGYDEATGLGSIDLYNLLAAWSGSSTGTSLVASTTVLSAATTTPVSGANDVITISVGSASTSATSTPTGTITIAVDGTTENIYLTLSSGETTYTFSSTTAGSHTIQATYSGDSVYAASTALITVTVPSTTTAVTGFTLTASAVTVATGSQGTSTITVTPVNGYTGTIAWVVSSSPSFSNGCYTISDANVTGSAAVTALTIYTSASACSTSTLSTGNKGTKRRFIDASTQADRSAAESRRFKGEMTLPFLAGLVFFGLLGRRAKRIRPLVIVLIVAAAGLVMQGCGSGASTASTASAESIAGTYTLTITGTDTSVSSKAASTTTTLTIQ